MVESTPGATEHRQAHDHEYESSFFHRSVLQDSHAERVNVLNGRVCYVIVRDIIDFGEYRGRRQWRKLTKFVDANICLPHAWSSEFRLGKHWESGEVWRVVERFYHYKEVKNRE